VRGGAVGTTLQGIGPAYQLKAARTGIRASDLIESSPTELEQMITALAKDVCERIDGMRVTTRDIITAMNKDEQAQRMTKGLLPYLSGNDIEHQAISDLLKKHSKRFAPFITDTSYFLAQAQKEGKSILFEGAQGTLLDIDHGSYPGVTSSNTATTGMSTLTWSIGHPTRFDTILGPSSNWIMANM